MILGIAWEQSPNNRTRQNVIFEAGFSAANLGGKMSLFCWVSLLRYLQIYTA